METLKPINASFIHGEHVAPSGMQRPNIFPGNNQPINQTHFATESNIAHAVESAQQAYPAWSTLTMNQRSNILIKAASLLRQQLPALAAIEVWDTGKPISEAMAVDVNSAADCLEYFAKIALAFENSMIPDSNALIYTSREPLGVCVGIGAWNYPLQIACWKAAPALMMGNTMVYKPSEHTPMTTLKLAEIFLQAGMPSGVFNVVLGDGQTAEKLLQQPLIAKVSFTGSVPTGKRILKQMAEKLVPATLELGGKSPLIIFDDADIDQAVIGALLGNFYTQGEICSNGTRVFIHRKQHDLFLDKLLHRVKKLKIGDPFAHETQIGALISGEHLNKVSSYIEHGKKEGAELHYGGTRLDSPGNFLHPAIFTQCHDKMKIVQEEIFGPVMTLLTFDEEEEVVKRANNTEFGLAAGIFTNHIKRAHRVAKQLQAGVCWINNYNITPVAMPFGGYKSSGLGRENGLTALTHYSQLKSIYVELNQIEHSYD